MIDYKILRQKLELLPKSTIVLIAGHKNADYDSIGSCIALAHILTKLGYAAYALLEDKDMSKAEWLNTSLVINEYTAEQPFNFILLDSPRKERLGKFEPLFDKALLTICIDHHEIQKCEATYTFVDEYISSTAEIIANLAKGYANIMDKNIATHLYAGIVSDTNSFYRRVIPSTMTVASMLMQYNVDNTFVVKNACKNYSLRDGTIISHMLKNLEYDIFHYIVLNRKDNIVSNASHNTLFKKCASFVYDLNDIDIFGLFVIEHDGSISAILRSNTHVNVDGIAKEFGGGGHKKAAGFETCEDIEIILAKTKNLIQAQG